MTFTELVNEVMARTRQTSLEAQQRIGREVNDRYRRVGTSIGTQNLRQLSVTTPTVLGVPTISFVTGVKPITVWIESPSFRRVLTQITMDDYRQRSINNVNMTSVPTFYTIGEYAQTGSPTVYLFPTPDAVYTIRADVIAHAVDLAGTDVPTFPSDFHDILVHGAAADEWFQLKQEDMASRAESMYEARLSELRMFIAKSNTLAIVQGGRGGFTRGDYLPGYTVPPPGWYR